MINQPAIITAQNTANQKQSDDTVDLFRANKLLGVKQFDRGRAIWYSKTVGKDKWDGLMYQAKKDLRVYAVGIHGRSDGKPRDGKPRDFTVGYKFVI